MPTEKWRYIRYADGSEELYDLENDPHEWTNLADLEGHAEVKAELAAYLPATSLPPAPGSAHRILTYDGETAIWEGREIDPDQESLPGDVPVSDPEAEIFLDDAAPVRLMDSGAGEGPAWHPRWGLLCSSGGDIHQLMPGGMRRVWKEGAGSNGLLFDGDGSLIVCEPGQRRVSRHHGDGEVTVLADAFEGKRFNSPNDVTVDSRGRLYFTDPRYGSRDGMEITDADGRAIEGVYRIDPDGSIARVITHEVDRPNGVLVSGDGRHLFVADNHNNTPGGARKLWRFDLDGEGNVALDSCYLVYDWGRTRGPDGLAQDREGRLYVAAGIHEAKPPVEIGEVSTAGIYVLSSTGALLDFVAIPHDEVTNCAFGGLTGRRSTSRREVSCGRLEQRPPASPR